MESADDQLATRKKLMVPTVLATFSRYLPPLDVHIGYRVEEVLATFGRVFRTAG